MDYESDRHPNSRISTQFVGIILSLLDPKDFEALQISYGLLVKKIISNLLYFDILTSFILTLLDSISILNKWLKGETINYKDVKRKEGMLLIYVAALKPLAAVKNSLVIVSLNVYKV